MSEQDEQVTVIQDGGGSNAGKWILILLAAIYVAASLYFLVDLRGRATKLAEDQAASQKQIGDLTTRMQAAEAEAETLGQQVGITKKELESWGGSYVHFVGTLPEDPDAFDVVIMNNLYLGGAPEMRPYYLITAKNDMRFLPMPQDLRESMAKEVGGHLVDIPTALVRGVDTPVPSVGTSARAIYAKEDLSADFTYTVAKSLDANRDLFRWTHVPFTYDSRLVTQLPPVPLHSGAERYYREVGYIK